jgi:hypothetical protein
MTSVYSPSKLGVVSKDNSSVVYVKHQGSRNAEQDVTRCIASSLHESSTRPLDAHRSAY